MLRKMIREEIQKMDEMYDPDQMAHDMMYGTDSRDANKFGVAKQQPSGGSQYGSPAEEELMKLKAMCKQDGPGSKACMQASEMEQYMYGQGGRMFESKRKKNG